MQWLGFALLCFALLCFARLGSARLGSARLAHACAAQVARALRLVWRSNLAVRRIEIKQVRMRPPAAHGEFGFCGW
jgi:hypothetical protein